MTDACLQELYSPRGACFGCGPANPHGLHLRSFVQGAEVIAQWQPDDRYQAFPGMLNGGIIGTLLDCHSNWTAAWHLMRRGGLATPPCTVTAEFAVKLRRPTPVDSVLTVRAVVVASDAVRATVESHLAADGAITATCRGLFVSVKEGHPAFHRW